MFPPFQFRLPVCSSFPLIRFLKKLFSFTCWCMCGGESRYVYEEYYAGKEEEYSGRLRPAEGGGGRSRVVVGPTLS